MNQDFNHMLTYSTMVVQTLSRRTTKGSQFPYNDWQTRILANSLLFYFHLRFI